VRIAAVRRFTVLSILLLLSAGVATAQNQPGNDQDQVNKPQAERAKPKEPAPPLFPRHRRGFYKNAQGDEVIDATPQSPPLDTDDPGVPDKGEYEINLSTHADYAREARRFDLLSVDANYGILPFIAGCKLPTQIKFEFPVAAAREAGEPYTVGLGAAKVGMKFNFYRDEHRGIAVSLYPQLEFAAPGGRGVQKGLAENGQTFILPLLVAREFHEFTFAFNGAIEKAMHDPGRQTASEIGVAFGRAFTRKVAAMIELRTESSVDFKSDRLVFVNAGFIHGVRNVIVYANLGHSIFSDDGFGHTYAGFGMKVLIDPKK
jgi:hypothetical protein